MRYAPIVLFAFNRPDHLSQTVAALAANSEADQSHLHIYLDGPRHNGDIETVEQVRKLARNVQGFKSVSLIERVENYGLARNIIDGVSAVCFEHGRVIVVEDDLVTSPHFLSYMNTALELYKNEPRVASIHGYVYPVQSELPETFFMRGADCWGWATWERAWRLFEPNGKRLLQRIYGQQLARSFNHNHSHDYVAMLEDQIAGRNRSWAIRWHASAFLANKLTLYPGRSLVSNIGNDGSGTHCGVTHDHDVMLAKRSVNVCAIPIEQSEAGAAAFESFVSTIHRIGTRRRFEIATRTWRQRWKDRLKGQRLTRRLAKLTLQKQLRIEGPYASWAAAMKASQGYESQQILEKVFKATCAVQSGSATAERDSFVIDEESCLWPFLAMAMLTRSRSSPPRLSVLDFGGSLGSSYFQHRKLMKGLPDLKWGVVEQAHFVACGREFIADEVLSFHNSVAECVTAIRPNLVLLSGVVQYLENPAALLAEVAACDAEVIIVDRTPMSDAPLDFIGVQHVPKEIYEASYPIRILTRTAINEALGESWRELGQFESLDHIPSPWNASWKGAIYVRR